MMKTSSRLAAALAFALAVTRALAGGAATPIADGPAVDAHVRFEFAIYYPTHPPVEPRAALRSRIAAGQGMPRLVEHLSKDEAAAEVSASVTTQALKEYAPPSVDMSQLFGRGLSPGQAEALSHADEALVMEFNHPGKDRMAALRAAQVLAEQVARDTHGLLWDDETRESFTPDAWHERRVLGWVGELPDVSRHTVLHFYRSGDGYRCISLGMVKFGEPDVVVEDLVASDSRTLGNLVNVLAQALVEGATTDARGQLAIRLQQSRHPEVNRSQGEDLKPNAKRSARLLLVRGVADKGDPENRLVRIAFDRYDGPDEHARQAALSAELYGSTDRVSRIRHDEKLLAARDAARARLPALRDAFNRGLAPGEYLDVKAPFATDSGGHEWMWVEVRAWKGDRIEGTLQNEPDDVRHLRSGQDVVVSQAELFDYLFHHADGKVEGNTTGAIIEEMEREGH
jgi:uncharacterized protein YegJ (DUF2314 family)